MILLPPRSTQSKSSAASDVYKRQVRHQPRGRVIEGVGVTGAVPRPRHLRGDDPMLGAVHPRRVGLQERPDQAQVQRSPPPPAFALVIAGAALPAARRTRRPPRRPWPTRAAQPIALQKNARRSPHPRFQPLVRQQEPLSLIHIDAADDLLCVDLGGRRIIKKKKKKKKQQE